MMTSIRECQFKGHHDSKPSRICIFKECNKCTRWCCAECLIDKQHAHKQPNENHIKKQEEFIQLLRDQQIIQSHNINLIENSLNGINQQAKKLISSFSNLLQGYKTNKSELITQATNDFLSIDKTQINEIIDFNNKQLNLEQLSDMLQGFQKKLEELQQFYNKLVGSVQINENVQSQQYKSCDIERIQTNETISYQDLQYDFQDYFELRENYQVYAFQISPNEQLVAYGGYNKTLTLLNLQTKQIVKQIKLDYSLFRCQFTQDSSFIFCGDQGGFIYCYHINQNFKELYKSQVHQEEITSIFVIENYLVASCSYKYSIIITDIIKNQKLIIIPNAHKHWINQIQYDSVNQVIISCSRDKSIKFFSKKNGDVLIDQQNVYERGVLLIQLTYNRKNLLSGSLNQLILWQIEYKQRKLIQVRKFEERDYLQSFFFLQNDGIIVKIYSKYMLLLDNNFNQISKYNHNIDVNPETFWYFQNQSNSLNYILINGKDQIKIFKRVNQLK